MRIRPVKEVIKLNDDYGGYDDNGNYNDDRYICNDHITPENVVKGYIPLFLDLPYPDVDFRKLNIQPLIKKMAVNEGCSIRDGEEIVDFSNENGGLDLIYTHLLGLSMDKEDIVYSLRLKQYASQEEVIIAENEFLTRLKKTGEDNVLTNLLAELYDLAVKFNKGNNGWEYFRRVLFSNTFPSFNEWENEEFPRNEDGSLPPIFPSTEISRLEKMLGQRYSSNVLRSAGIPLAQEEAQPLKWLEKFEQVKFDTTTDYSKAVRTYLTEFEKTFPEFYRKIKSMPMSDRKITIIAQATVERDKHQQMINDDADYAKFIAGIEGFALEDDLRIQFSEMKDPFSRIYIENILLNRFFGYPANGQYQYVRKEPNRFSGLLFDLDQIGEKNFVLLVNTRTMADPTIDEYYQATQTIIEMYNKTIARWNNVSCHDGVKQIINDYTDRAIKQRDTFILKYLTYLFGDVLTVIKDGYPFFKRSYAFYAAPRNVYNTFLGFQTLLRDDSSREYVTEVVKLFDRIDKLGIDKQRKDELSRINNLIEVEKAHNNWVSSHKPE